MKIVFCGVAKETAIKSQLSKLASPILMLSPQTILQNRYRVMRELKRGGMGTVYEAVDQRLTSKVALKEMLGVGDAHAQTAFEREAALLANLDYPNLPKVIDHFSEKDGAYLVMQFIEGMDLEEWLDVRGSPFPQVQVLQWADTLLDLLEYLHGHNPPIVHRDIKPSNIKQTEDGRIFLLDFGLAKGSLGQMPTYESDRSMRGGTPRYAPLEQLHGSGTDGRSDLYSVGATLFHLISGVLPIDAGSRYQAMEEGEPDPFQTFLGFASPKVASVIETSISISRKQRFANAAEMRRALRDAAQEDARNNLREEYKSTDQKRRQREKEWQDGAEAVAPWTEEARQHQEAEIHKKEELEKQNSTGSIEDQVSQRKKTAQGHDLKDEKKEELRRAELAPRAPAKLSSSILPLASLDESGKPPAKSVGRLRKVANNIITPLPQRVLSIPKENNTQDSAVRRESNQYTARRRVIAVTGATLSLVVVCVIVLLLIKSNSVSLGSNETKSSDLSNMGTPDEQPAPSPSVADNVHTNSNRETTSEVNSPSAGIPTNPNINLRKRADSSSITRTPTDTKRSQSKGAEERLRRALDALNQP